MILAAAVPAGAGAAPVEDVLDLRSPDARDAALAAAQQRSKGAPVARVERAGNLADGFDWGDAGIRASGMLGLLAIGGGAFMILGVQRRRRDYRTASQPGIS